jgi:thymidylate synthase ThyX
MTTDTTTTQGVSTSSKLIGTNASAHQSSPPANPLQEVYLMDDLHPEDNAMLQALYSRSPRSVLDHLDKVKGADSGQFMEKFYVGYGHASIGDCGSTTLFIEYVSMLVAKAVQDWQLYSGQEASTRYLDYSKQPVLNPANSSEGAEIQDKWMDFYSRSTAKVQEHLQKKFPIEDGQKELIYEKAIAAKSFDIMRSFLPAGCTTFLSWHTNLRQASDHLAQLEHHPLQEIRGVAGKILSKLRERYTHSFSHQRTPEQEEYLNYCQQNCAYFDPEKHPDFACETNITNDQLEPYLDLLQKRPAKTGLPVFMGKFGQFNFKFKLDFGSFRDIQRHRNGECLMPLLTTRFGFYPWYLEQLPNDVRAEAEQIIKEQEVKINALPVDKFIRQYYIPMGYTIAVDVTYKLPATLYVAELRSNKTVHPTLRQRAHQMSRAIVEKFPQIKIHSDFEASEWDIRRGQQDIVKKD